LGGVASAKVVDQSSLESNFDGTVKIKQRNVVKDSQGRLMVMGRNTILVVADQDGTERAVHRLPYGTHLRVDDGSKVKRGDRLAEWDPYTRPVLTEIEGIVDFEDLVEGVSVSERKDESTGITNSVIIDWRASPRGVDLRPAVAIKDKKGKIGKLSRGGEARYLLPVDAIMSVESGHEVSAGDVLARIPMESAKTRDITGGLPRVAELFEARRPKDHAIIAEISGTVQLGRDYKNKRRITIVPDDGEEPVEYLIPKGRHLAVQEGDRIEKGEFLLDGHPAPHDILAIKGVEELANYLVNEIQEVYRLQGVTINDKHIEVIVRQMLQKTEVEDPGSTDFLKGEQVDRIDLEDANELVVAGGGKPATGQPVLLGITKASLQTRSFISAASFQETTRVLTDAAVNGKTDALEGLKENVIVGRLIPAGTGGMLTRLSKIASHRDELILEERERTASDRLEQDDDEAAEERETV
jgi:DNA-directed RNA polymerase subunit beta'